MFLLFFTYLDLGRLPAEDRAVQYLIREVPRWTQENKCYSCHNNGDGARALYSAIRLGRKIPDKALADTTRWLKKPKEWNRNAGDQKFSDKQLDQLQFGMAFVEAVDSGQITTAQPLQEAAELIAARQHRDGFWPIGEGGALGSPVTHGDALATAHARRLLDRADPVKFQRAIGKADDWLRHRPVKTVLDAASVLLALEKADDAAALKQRTACYAIIRKGEAYKGGWGPYVQAAPEVFDTALVVLALGRQPQDKEIETWRRRGRAYLLQTQQKDGSWPETTRPSGADSYAQRISTTAWATQALLQSK
ncbi:MAG: hypothetical protein ACJ8FY_05810 [Gemmataceae bacterium]